MNKDKKKQRFFLGNESDFILIYLSLKPVYLFQSGIPQVSDFLMMFFIIYTVFKHKGHFIFPERIAKAIRVFAFLLIYQVIINAVYTGVTGSNLSLASIYYVFNFLVFFEFAAIYTTTDFDDIISALIKGITVGMLLSFIGLLFFSTSIRKVGFFNNPNQLGYYATIIFSFTIALQKKMSLKRRLFLYVTTIWAVIASGSKAGFVAIAIMLFINLIVNRENKKVGKLILRIFILLMAVLILYIFLFSNSTFITSNQTLSFMKTRLLKMQNESDSNLGSGRGYDRIFELGINVIFGVGEGAYNRFDTLHGLEVHSSYVTMIVCYGLIGMLLLAVFIWRCLAFKKFLIYNFVLSIGIFMYGITHNGLRNTLMWLFFAFMLCSSFNESEAGLLPEGNKRIPLSRPQVFSNADRI